MKTHEQIAELLAKLDKHATGQPLAITGSSSGAAVCGEAYKTINDLLRFSNRWFLVDSLMPSAAYFHVSAERGIQVLRDRPPEGEGGWHTSLGGALDSFIERSS